MLLMLMLLPLRMFADGWTPTDAGLVANLKVGDRFLISVWIDVDGDGVEDAGEEFFVCDYPSYTGGRFSYTAGNFLKLRPQDAGATTPSPASIWTVDTALTRVKDGVNYALGGISYTMWGNSGNTLMTTNDNYHFLGDLSSNKNHNYLCDAVFVIPTVRARENMDPNGTLNASHTLNGRNRGTGAQSWAFDGNKRIGFAGMAYREVYWFEIPRFNNHICYTNAALVTFNTTTSEKNWSAGKIKPGKAAYAYADSKHNPTTRTLFRFYNLTEQIESCDDSYFFAHDEQDYVKYRWGPNDKNHKERTMADSTSARKIYTNDHLHCMERDGSSEYYKTDLFRITYESDSIYYYIGKNNKYYSSAEGNTLGSTAGAYSQFRKFHEMRIRPLANAATPFVPAHGTCGRVVVDTTSGAENLGAAFEPAGYFLNVSTGKNVRLVPNADGTEWTCDEAWTITPEWAALSIKTTLFTGAEFSETDPGADIVGWSEMQVGTSVPVLGSAESVVGKTGWARIYPGNASRNGNMVFVLARDDRYIHYDNNGFIGVEVPDQYPASGETTVTVKSARLKEGFTFLGWNTSADGSGTAYAPGDVVDLPEGKTTLYAQATYDGVYNIALSFLHPTNGKRYFLSHPGMSAPRYAKALHYEDWTSVRQGLSNAANDDPDHVTTYQLFEDTVAHNADERLFVLEQETLHGYEDSLTFNEDYYSQEDYVGLYFADNLNVILANDTWAGLFKSTNGWPDYAHPKIASTKLYSTHYNNFLGGAATRQERPNATYPPYIKYNAAADHFEGVADPANATDFQLSAVVMADAHYVVLPDTSDAEQPWPNSITFGYHNNEQTTREVWSVLKGRQLMACMIVGEDTTYFHPNKNKLYNTESELRLSSDFRLNQTFTLIRDSRVSAQHVLAPGDEVTMTAGTNLFNYHIRSGSYSPMDIQSGSRYIDVVDTLRITLRPGGISKIKDYYGRWKTGAAGLHVNPDGSRYRDILITTKTYHYSPNQIELHLLPALESYDFGPQAGHSETVNFVLARQTYRQLLDADGNVIRTEVLSSDTIDDVLNLSSATCTLAKGGEYFSIDAKTSNSITLTTLHENDLHDNLDTLTVSTQVTIGGVPYAVSASVPLNQTDLTGVYMIWSVVHEGTRYFVTAGSGGLQFRQYTGITNSRLLRNGNELIIGSANAANSDHQYLTPWFSDYPEGRIDQLTFWTEYGVNKRLVYSGGSFGVANMESGLMYLTYKYVELHKNSNGNFEEKVRLKYGADKWVKFNGTALVLADTEEEGSVFCWTYLKDEYSLLNNGKYPDKQQEEFTYNSTRSGSIQTRYKAYKEYSVMLDNQTVYVAKESEEKDIADLIDSGKDWKTQYSITHVRDSRTATLSGLSISTNATTLTTTITPSGDSPKDVKVNGEYVNIVDTLDVRLSLQDGAPDYHFKGDWNGFTSIDDAHLKIPLIRRTYHDVPFDSIVCVVDHDDYNHAFPNTLREGVSRDSLHTFTLYTERRQGTNTLNVYGEVAASTIDEEPEEVAMDLTSISMAQVRLLNDHGKAPSWCRIEGKTANTITVRCLGNGERSPRSATLYIAYMVEVNGKKRFVDYHMTISQASLFQYANNQHLVHSQGASGDTLMNGMQQTHENKRILYYYNPAPYDEDDQEVELPLRERGFYGWWRWYREGNDQNGADVGDTDIPDSVWIVPPRNVGGSGNKYNFPFRIIGDSVWVDEADHSKGKKLVTQGRYTVFHYPSINYGNKNDPASKTPRVHAPYNKVTATYVVDIGNYFDNLPLQMAEVNQIDTAMLDTMKSIIEPTLSVREIYELHPWTEMAERLENYKTSKDGPFTNDKYLEDHVVMAPVGNRLLLKTEQRYRYENLAPQKDKNGRLVKERHSESLLGYYMRDDNWATAGWSDLRKDTMIWCGGWDADCLWYTYNPRTGAYASCSYPVTADEDFLNVPTRGGLSNDDQDTVYYCLRARSRKTTGTPGDDEETVDGDWYFNICRYKVIYHDKAKYGPRLEDQAIVNEKGETWYKALITNDEIEQDYEVLERLNFDYNQPGEEYVVYPHPLPWADVSYGYSYPAGPEIPDNRYHNDFAPNFAGPGEYGIINFISSDNGATKYQRPIQQHTGRYDGHDKEKGYMIYCDGMSSAGQVAALSLSTNLCEGQKMYFSAYVGNTSNQENKAKPNFTVSVQGSKNDGNSWEDIASYMTGDIDPSDRWYQIFFPIDHDHAYDKFRVRIYNMASSFDGNDFVIDDMCVFATKPPLIAYQANTKCVEQNENDSIIHMVLRIDYQGFIDDSYNNADVHYTVEQITKTDPPVHSFVPMIDHYLNEQIIHGTIDTVYGYIRMPARNYTPTDEDSVFHNINELAERFEATVEAHEAWEKTDRSTPEPELYRKGYIREVLDGVERPVLYIVHKAKMAADKQYKVRMSLGSEGLMNSKCAMTSNLKVTNRMILMLNGDEQEEKKVDGICANATYDVSLRVKGTLIQDGTAPQDMNGSCKNDWLLYGDTAEVSSLARYGYKYSDIEKVVKDILRYDPAASERNANQFARNLSEVNRNEMLRVQIAQGVVLSDPALNPYTILSDLVTTGFLTLYKSDVMVTVDAGDSVQYVAFPIVGTGSDILKNMSMEVCPTPIVIKLKSKEVAGEVPLIIGGLHRDSIQAREPVVVLADEATANSELVIPIDSINTHIGVGVQSIDLIETNDPNYHEGVHHLSLEPERQLPRDIDNYYINGDALVLWPSSSNNYSMRQGYTYTYLITIQRLLGGTTDDDGCPIGTVPFIVAVVPDYLRWNPKSEDSKQWNNHDNWIGINRNNQVLHEEANFAPLATTKVLIPAQTDGLPYPELPDPSLLSSSDSVKQVGFIYNTCDAIRFLPDAAIYQQQRLTYNDVIVDMSVPQQKWALRSAPVMGLLSGDLFMANADLNGISSPWETGEFDANGRSYTTGNGSFWLSLYSKDAIRQSNGTRIDTVKTEAAEWSKVTNALSLSLQPAQGLAVFSRTKSGRDAVVRLPKNDDIYYYYTKSGEKVNELYEPNLRVLRAREAGGADKVGKLAFYPGKEATSQSYILSNGTAATTFVFGNPTMGYIDIWGFIEDNTDLLEDEIGYMGSDGQYNTVTKESLTEPDAITSLTRYLPPMHALVLKKKNAAATSLGVTINTNRIVTDAAQIVRPEPSAPSKRRAGDGLQKGIMTVTATNAASSRCTSRLLLGQGWHAEIIKGEDAMLTTINIDNYTNTSAPATPFNIYAVEGSDGLSIDLRDEILYVPLSFYMSDLPFDPVTHLWFTGVNAVDGPLVLWDSLTDTEYPIIDGICIDIETPEENHEMRYYIRRPGYKPDEQTDPQIPTGVMIPTADGKAVKIFKDGHVFILRNGHIYTTVGQKIQ